MLWPDALAAAGSPLGWLAVALLVLVVFAPQLLPVVGRILGKLARRELKRRIGLPTEPVARIVADTVACHPAARAQVAEALAPPSQDTAAEALPAPSAPPMEPQRSGRKQSRTPLWAGGLVVGGAVAVLLWYLLHAR